MQGLSPVRLYQELTRRSSYWVAGQFLETTALRHHTASYLDLYNLDGMVVSQPATLDGRACNGAPLLDSPLIAVRPYRVP